VDPTAIIFWRSVIKISFHFPSWNQQHEYLEKLNMQAVLSASQHEDEFVKEFFISFEKVGSKRLSQIIECL